MENILPRIGNSGQGLLFPILPHEVCKRIGLPWWAAVKLFEDQLISFNPEEERTLTEGQEAELCFIGALVACDCSSKMLDNLLESLIFPYEYQHSRIYYDWALKGWRELPEQQEPQDLFYEWISTLMDNGDAETLQEIKEHIDGLVEDSSEDS